MANATQSFVVVPASEFFANYPEEYAVFSSHRMSSGPATVGEIVLTVRIYGIALCVEDSPFWEHCQRNIRNLVE
jgi:hypothetical protein